MGHTESSPLGLTSDGPMDQNYQNNQDTHGDGPDGDAILT